MEGEEKTDGCGAGGKMLAAGVSIGSIHLDTFFYFFYLTIDTRQYLYQINLRVL